VAQKGPPVQIFLGNLAFTVTEQDVRELFAPYGVVDRINLVTDRETGRPRGFGFVEMADDTAAQAAIAALNGHALVVLGRNNPSLYTVNGRPLYVHLNGLAIVLLK